jgi:hypothetical protein
MKTLPDPVLRPLARTLPERDQELNGMLFDGDAHEEQGVAPAFWRASHAA